MHIPSPLRITDHVGYDMSRDDLVREILTLTKMNWNSARLGGMLPITLGFSRTVAEDDAAAPRPAKAPGQ